MTPICPKCHDGDNITEDESLKTPYYKIICFNCGWKGSADELDDADIDRGLMRCRLCGGEMVAGVCASCGAGSA